MRRKWVRRHDYAPFIHPKITRWQAGHSLPLVCSSCLPVLAGCGRGGFFFVFTLREIGMAAVLRGEGNDGDVVHVRVPPDLHEAIRKLAKIHGRPVTGEILYQLDTAIFGPRELRLIKGGLGEN